MDEIVFQSFTIIWRFTINTKFYGQLKYKFI